MLEKITEIVDAIADFFSGDAVNLLGKVAADAYGATLRSAAEGVINAEFIATAYQTLIPVALCIMFIEFAMKLMEMVIDEQVSLDKIIKHFILMLLMMFMLDTGIVREGDANTGWIMKMYTEVAGVADDLVPDSLSVDVVGEMDENFSDTFKGEEDDEEPKGFWYWITHLDEILEQIIQTILTSVALAALGLILELVVAIFAMYRAIRLGVYICMAPIGIAMCYTNSFGAMSYFKKVLAIILQEPIIMISTKVCFFVLSTSDAGFRSTLVVLVIVICSLIGQIFSSEQKAKELIG